MLLCIFILANDASTGMIRITKECSYSAVKLLNTNVCLAPYLLSDSGRYFMLW